MVTISVSRFSHNTLGHTQEGHSGSNCKSTHGGSLMCFWREVCSRETELVSLYICAIWRTALDLAWRPVPVSQDAMWVAMEKLSDVRGNYGVFSYLCWCMSRAILMRCGVGSFFPVLGSSLVLNRIALAVQELGLGLQCLRSNCGETLLKKKQEILRLLYGRSPAHYCSEICVVPRRCRLVLNAYP